MLFSKRDQFYDKTSSDTTPGQYNPTPVPQRRHTRRKQSDQFRFTFGSRNLTQVGGYPLLEEVMENHNIRRSFHRYLKKPRGSHGFTTPEISTFQVVGKLLGCRRLDHIDRYRFDPMITQFFGIDGLPSDTTIGRHNKSFSPSDNEKLANLNQKVTDQTLGKIRKSMIWHPQSEEENPFRVFEENNRKLEVTLDVDGTELTIYGKQENGARGRSSRKKDTPQYRLLASFVAGLGLWVDFDLLSGNYHLGGNGKRMVTRGEKTLPEWIRVGAVRGDNALYCGEDIKEWIDEGKTVGITATCNKKLMKQIGKISANQWQPVIDENGDIEAEIAEITFSPPTWDHGPYRYIISRTKREKPKQTQQKQLFDLDETYDYWAYITNHSGDKEEAYQFVVGRCDVENCVKESKVGFGGEHVPHDEFEGNQAYLGHVQLAYNLKISMSMDLLPEGADRYQRERLVRELIRVPAKLIKDGNSWIVSIACWWPYKDLLKKGIRNRKDPP